MEHQEKTKVSFNEVTKKMIVMMIMAPFLIVPLGFVGDQIHDRKEFESSAQQEVAKGWGAEITIGTPVLTYLQKNIYATTGETNIEIASQEKKRGVFKVPVYVANFKTTISFLKPEQTLETNAVSTYNYRDDYLLIPIQPTNSIQSFTMKETLSEKELKATLSHDGIRVALDQFTAKNFFDKSIQIEIVTRGTGLITYQSSADKERVKMLGNWVKPKFADDILPSYSKLNSKGFEATWDLNALPSWESGPRQAKSIGMHHLWVGTDYSMLERAVKYGVLFIALTFILMFVVEFVGSVKVHPIQYALVGLSICVFYLLLLAISESIGFNWAYAISSLAVTGLIGYYVGGFLQQKKFVKLILAEQVILNVFFYVLLTLEETSLLIGSIGLFMALAALMTITRKFDWYRADFKTQMS
jgi:inner membrane protein